MSFLIFLIVNLPYIYSQQIYSSIIPVQLILTNGEYLEAVPKPEASYQMINFGLVLPQDQNPASDQIRYTQPYADTPKISLTGLVKKPTQLTDPEQRVVGYLASDQIVPRESNKLGPTQFNRYMTFSDGTYSENPPNTGSRNINGRQLVDHVVYHTEGNPISRSTLEQPNIRNMDFHSIPVQQHSTQPQKPPETHKHYYQDILIEKPSPYQIDFGHVLETPSRWEERFERNNMKDHRYQGKDFHSYTNILGDGSYASGFGKGNRIHSIESNERALKNINLFQRKVKWADTNGGYGEHYWDLGHVKV